MITKACPSDGNDCRHDSYLTQKFIDLKLEWLKVIAIDAGVEDLSWFAVHFDNAASHFKNPKTLHYLTKVPEQHTWIKKCSWNFGCPGHGKGVWDGIGGAIKRGIRRDVLDGYSLPANGKQSSCRSIATSTHVPRSVTLNGVQSMRATRLASMCRCGLANSTGHVVRMSTHPSKTSGATGALLHMHQPSSKGSSQRHPTWGL